MTKFNVDDHVVVANRGDKWEGLTGKIERVNYPDYSPLGQSYRLKMDEPFSPSGPFSDGIHATFFDDHLDFYTEPVVEDDYTRSARILKNYMEDNRLTDLKNRDDFILAVIEVLEADLRDKGYSENTVTDRSRDFSVNVIEPHINSLRPVLEAYWK